MDSTLVNTKGYKTLLNLVDNTVRESFDLYYGLFIYNVKAVKQLNWLDLDFESTSRLEKGNSNYKILSN
jgi:arogenate dehydrogenase (NADP+)